VIAQIVSGNAPENVPLSLRFSANIAEANKNQAIAAAAAAEEEKKFKRRFRVERVAFIACAAALMAVLTALGVFPKGMTETFGGALGLAAITAFMVNGAYVAHASFGGPACYFERLPVETVVPKFDWRRFAMQPLYFLVALALVCLVVGLGLLFKWANSGGHH
jgi:hypothetical protein